MGNPNCVRISVAQKYLLSSIECVHGCYFFFVSSFHCHLFNNVNNKSDRDNRKWYQSKFQKILKNATVFIVEPCFSPADWLIELEYFWYNFMKLYTKEQENYVLTILTLINSIEYANWHYIYHVNMTEETNISLSLRSFFYYRSFAETKLAWRLFAAELREKKKRGEKKSKKKEKRRVNIHIFTVQWRKSRLKNAVTDEIDECCHCRHCHHCCRCRRRHCRHWYPYCRTFKYPFI